MHSRYTLYMEVVNTPGRILLGLSLSMLLTATVAAEERPTPVSVVTAKTGELREEVPLTGTVASIRTARISPKEAGYIESLRVDESDIVSKGDVILELDRQLAELEVARVQAQLNEARARQRELVRQRDEAAELVKKKHIASTAFEAAAAEVEINKAVIQRLETELRRQQVVLERHTVYAPFDGVIAEKLVEVGQWVNSNTPLFSLIELNPLRIEVSVPQFYFNRLNVDTPVSIRYDAIPDQVFSASVTAKIPVSDQTARTFPVFISIENTNQVIAPGMSARVTFKLLGEETVKSLLLPRDAIVQKPDGTKTVWVVADKDGASQATPVKVITGKNVRANVEIKSEQIMIGDRIVVKGNELLQPGQAVNVIEQLDYPL